MEAYLCANCIPGMVWEIADEALKIKGVETAYAVTGQFDVIAYIQFADMNELREIIEQFMSLNGVQRTQTAIVIPRGLG
ncbi:MAG: Lrp/AsnC ligand binding domain-containing protein [Candidatus Bathyarchaeota archaeon]|nr:MAG: Lrp/AsnC ligand binding domain-containing protein [Candidatus Bathyarchaeota archaeon]